VCMCVGGASGGASVCVCVWEELVCVWEEPVCIDVIVLLLCSQPVCVLLILLHMKCT